jgi:hypothetical protein
MTLTSLKAEGQQQHQDSGLIAAWDFYRAARGVLAALPDSGFPARPQSTAEEMQYRRMDIAEDLIMHTQASTPAGVEVKLWLALVHNLDGVEANDAAMRCDLECLLQYPGIDWAERMILSAISSLHCQG